MKEIILDYVKNVTKEKDLDYFDEFVTQWKALGGDQIMEEATEIVKNQG